MQNLPCKADALVENRRSNFREIRGRTEPRGTRGNVRNSSARLVGTPDWTGDPSDSRMETKTLGDLQVKLVDMPDMNLARVRFIGPYTGIAKAFHLLYFWAEPLGLMTPDSLILGIYHDIPGNTPPGDLRSDACLCVPPGTKARAPVSIKPFNSRGRYACGYFEFRDEREFPRAWNLMTAEWLPQSGYQFDERPTFEIYHGVFRVDICLPVKAL